MTIEVQENVPLAPLTTLKLGGRARYFMSASNVRDVEEALQFAHNKKLKVLVLGGGSNLVVSDQGFDGLVINLKLLGIESDVRGGRVLLTVAAGEPWDNVVAYAVEQGWGGIENLSGIPGSTGGAVVQNIGAYGQTLSDIIREVRVIEVATGQQQTFNRAAAKFGYRESFFKHTARDKYIMTSVVLQLTTNPDLNVSYKDMRGGLADMLKGKPLTVASVREVVVAKRASKGMVLMDGHEQFQSVGSFFVNPVVTRADYERIKRTASKINAEKTVKLEPWHWDEPADKVKLSAAFLIEFTPFKKGYRAGNVGISPKHSLALIAYPGGKTSELVALARQVQEKVNELFGVLLQPEPLFVGFDQNPLMVN